MLEMLVMVGVRAVADVGIVRSAVGDVVLVVLVMSCKQLQQQQQQQQQQQ